MTKAFVFGKFLPFHKGHEALIRFALDHCDVLTVLVCCSDRETAPGFVRKKWIEDTLAGQVNLEVEIFDYPESELPNTSETSTDVSKVWADVFKQLFPDYGLVITSEPYGDLVADFMQIQHLSFDIPRQFFPVSASAIREDMDTYRHFLPDCVERYFFEYQ